MHVSVEQLDMRPLIIVSNFNKPSFWTLYELFLLVDLGQLHLTIWSFS